MSYLLLNSTSSCKITSVLYSLVALLSNSNNFYSTDSSERANSQVRECLSHWFSLFSRKVVSDDNNDVNEIWISCWLVSMWHDKCWIFISSDSTWKCCWVVLFFFCCCCFVGGVLEMHKCTQQLDVFCDQWPELEISARTRTFSHKNWHGMNDEKQ